jgi:hypothetical protein
MPSRDGSTEVPRRRKKTLALVAAGIAAACAAAALVFILLATPPGTPKVAGTESLGRGIVDYRLEESVVDLAAVPGLVKEMGPTGLRAGWTRVLVHWNALQPAAPGTADAGDADHDGYADAYVKQLDTIVGQLHDSGGMNVILTMLDVPQWASDKSAWDSPAPGYTKGKYEPFYAPDMSNLTVQGQFRDLGAFLAKRYEGKARYFECWNEPNLGTYLYPQTPASATSGGAQTYLEMLKLWYAGVKSGSSDAVVIGGTTGPRGRGDAGSTPPQAFARYLKDHGAARYLDAYSHHPYTPGGSTRVSPGQMPNNPRRCVTLGNLSQLTSLFPGKPFYLTEYGYNTEYSRWFGVTVSKDVQARYLRQAFSYTAAHYPQVKALLWFLVDDWRPEGQPHDMGVYMGVRTADGERKPSWYAFARRAQ